MKLSRFSSNMLLQCIFLAVLMSGPVIIRAQSNTEEPIDSFAQRQYGLCVAAYKKKDVAAYTRLLDEWNARYDKLSGDEKKRLAPYSATTYYNLSCTYALLGNKTKALDFLHQSIQAGYSDYPHIQSDKDLDIVRKEARFIAMVAPLRATGDYMYILKRADKYNPGDKRPLPAFTYQPATDSGLIMLRSTFNLDSVAGKGNDVSKALNLLHWVHNLIPHDGNHENPVVKNALSLISVCKKESRGLNCRGLATVLNESCLALGFQSRIVTCLPKDSLGTDTDCHVINMVFIPGLHKWIWIDPTHNAYVMNEKGELLSIEEVRSAIVHNKPLILNPDADWNHRISIVKENYLYNYMAKNLYMLECPVNSQYDNETRIAGKTIPYIQLVPLDYFKQAPDKEESVDKKKGSTLVFYKTNDPGAFWSAPSTSSVQTHNQVAP